MVRGGRRRWTGRMGKGDGQRRWTERMDKRDGQRRWTKGMGGGDGRRRWAEEMDAAGPKPRETGDAEAGILRMDSAAANRGQESQEAGTKADERLGQEAADGRQGRKTPAQGTGNGELKGSRTLTKGNRNSELEGSETPAKRNRKRRAQGTGNTGKRGETDGSKMSNGQRRSDGHKKRRQQRHKKTAGTRWGSGRQAASCD